MSNYRVKLLLVFEDNKEQTRNFYVNAPTVADATDEAERQAREDPKVKSVYVDEVD